MRATSRGYIAGVGTTTALVAAAACAFVVVSAIVAFEGWPGARLGLHASTLDGSAGPRAGGATPPRLGTEPAASRPSDAATGRSRGSARDGSAPTGSVGGFGGEQTPGGTLESAGGTPPRTPTAGDAHQAGGHQPSIAPHGTSGSDDPAAPPPVVTPDDPTSPRPSGDGGGTGAGTVGGTVTQVTDTVGTTVTQTGQQLGGLVGTTTGQVGGIVGQVSPGLGQTVTQTGQAAGGVVSGATGTVGQVVQGTGTVVGSLLGGLGGGASRPKH